MPTLTWRDLTWGLRNFGQVSGYFAQHVGLVAEALLVALVFALPIGILVERHRRLDVPVMGLLGVIYTIPSLAFFIVLVPFLGLGRGTAVVPLVAYAQVILVRNVVTGLRGVDRGVREAARGMGMSAWQQLVRVELPLAMPVLLAGVRIAAVSTIALATLAALVNAGGLGTLLFVGVATANSGKILAGAAAVSALALAVNVGVRALERRAGGVDEGAGSGFTTPTSM